MTRFVLFAAGALVVSSTLFAQAPNPAIEKALAAAIALIGLYVWEYVWVFAGQSVPLS